MQRGKSSRRVKLQVVLESDPEFKSMSDCVFYLECTF